MDRAVSARHPGAGDAAGTVVTHRRRCGKPNCRCAAGEMLHPQVVLSYSLASRARSVTLPAELIEPVRDHPLASPRRSRSVVLV